MSSSISVQKFIKNRGEAILLRGMICLRTTLLHVIDTKKERAHNFVKDIKGPM
jgi:hypothetical protein